MSAICRSIYNLFVEQTEVVCTRTRKDANKILDSQRKGPGVVKSMIDLPVMEFLDAQVTVLRQGQIIDSSSIPKKSKGLPEAQQRADQIARSFHNCAGYHTQSPPMVRITPISKSTYGILETNAVSHIQKYYTLKLKPLLAFAVLASASYIGLNAF